jgi:D-serine deaminase-like pyridoxal phosphate-dependent protein
VTIPVRRQPSTFTSGRDVEAQAGRLDQLDTPVVTLDLDAIERNVDRMQDYCDLHRLVLRAHVKTHKLPQIASMQLARGAVGVACQKLGEAEAMADGGIESILVTFPLVGEAKWTRAARLARRVSLSVVGDSVTVARGLASHLPPTSSVGFLVECDTGLERCGVQSPADALELAREVAASPALRFDGLLTHPAPGRAQAWFEAARSVFAGAVLQTPVISVGGTPGALNVHERVPLATELRVGTYVFGDRACLLRGDVPVDDCAMRVRATVVSRPTSSRVILDAGSKTLTSDLANGASDGLFGFVVEYPELLIRELSEEHGRGELPRPSSAPAVGEAVSIIPNHACGVTNLHDHAYLHRLGKIVERAPIVARGAVR